MPKCFECWFVRALPTPVGENQALCLETKRSGRAVVALEDGACEHYEENPLVAYAMSQAYQAGQKAAGPTERQWNAAMDQAFDEGFREGGEEGKMTKYIVVFRDDKGREYVEEEITADRIIHSPDGSLIFVDFMKFTGADGATIVGGERAKRAFAGGVWRNVRQKAEPTITQNWVPPTRPVVRAGQPDERTEPDLAGSTTPIEIGSLDKPTTTTGQM